MSLQNDSHVILMSIHLFPNGSKFLNPSSGFGDLDEDTMTLVKLSLACSIQKYYNYQTKV